MTLHSPKRISSQEGLGLNTAKQLRFLRDAVAIGTETWNVIDTPWQESGIVIAEAGYVWRTRWEEGKPYIITNIFNAEGALVGVYCDVSSPVQRAQDGFECRDMYLDVWIVPGRVPVILDADELEAAQNAGYVTRAEAEDANRAARELAALYEQNSQVFDF